MFHLVVIVDFEGYQRGDRITDAALITAMLAGDRADFVMRVAAEQEAA